MDRSNALRNARVSRVAIGIGLGVLAMGQLALVALQLSRAGNDASFYVVTAVIFVALAATIFLLVFFILSTGLRRTFRELEGRLETGDVLVAVWIDGRVRKKLWGSVGLFQVLWASQRGVSIWSGRELADWTWSQIDSAQAREVVVGGSALFGLDLRAASKDLVTSIPMMISRSVITPWVNMSEAQVSERALLILELRSRSSGDESGG